MSCSPRRSCSPITMENYLQQLGRNKQQQQQQQLATGGGALAGGTAGTAITLTRSGLLKTAALAQLPASRLLECGATSTTGSSSNSPGSSSSSLERGSFLQEEEDEFERLFTELLYASHSRAAAARMQHEGCGDDDDLQGHTGGVEANLQEEPPPAPPPSAYSSLQRRNKSSRAATAERRLRCLGDNNTTSSTTDNDDMNLQSDITRSEYNDTDSPPSPRGGTGSLTPTNNNSDNIMDPYCRSLVEQGVLLDGMEDGDDGVGPYNTPCWDTVIKAGPDWCCTTTSTATISTENPHQCHNAPQLQHHTDQFGTGCSSGGTQCGIVDMTGAYGDTTPPAGLGVVLRDKDGYDDSYLNSVRRPHGDVTPVSSSPLLPFEPDPQQVLLHIDEDDLYLLEEVVTKPRRNTMTLYDTSELGCRAGEPLTMEARQHSMSDSCLIRGITDSVGDKTEDGHVDGHDNNTDVQPVTRATREVEDKLFFALLDDLDNLSGNTASMRRRAKARDIFSDWLFGEQLKQGQTAKSSERKLKDRKSFHELSLDGSADDFSDVNLASPEGFSRDRAGSEPSEGRRGSTNSDKSNLGVLAIQKTVLPLTMSEQDALLERRLREDYMVLEATGNRSRQVRPQLHTPPTSSYSPQQQVSQQVLQPSTVKTPVKTSELLPNNKKQIVATTGIVTPSNNKLLKQRSNSPRSSLTPATPPAFRRCAGSGISSTPHFFSAKHTTDTLEMLKNVKFRKKKNPDPSQTEGDNRASRLVPIGGPSPHGNIYQRWKLKGDQRALSFEYLSEKIYSDSTVIFSKRRSLEEGESHMTEPPEDLFATLHPDGKDSAASSPGAPAPPLVPQTAWNTLRQVPPAEFEAESSFTLNSASSDEYGSIRFDTVKTFVFEEDADLGYHTGENSTSFAGKGASAATSQQLPSPGERTLTREDLKQRIDSFNNNQHGLLMTLRESSDTFQGFIRVYMNLMRPISMSLTARPPSIYDILTPDASDPEEYESDTQLTSFYLPKDTTKVIHITSDTTAQEVIRALLQKFRITDNPRKFALYERLDEAPNKSTMRRLRDEECPLALCLCWTAEGLNFHRFILQENDTGEILWEAFSTPELENFLRILNREEDEYVDQVKAKYQLMKIQMVQHMKHLDAQRFSNKDQRTPVFV